MGEFYDTMISAIETRVRLEALWLRYDAIRYARDAYDCAERGEAGESARCLVAAVVSGVGSVAVRVLWAVQRRFV